MSFRKIVTGLALAGAVFTAAGAQAGGSSTTTTTDVFTPGAASVVMAAQSEIVSTIDSGGTVTWVRTADGGTTTTLPSGTTIAVSADGGTFTVTPPGGVPITVTSSFVFSVLAGYS
jgi:hypothetical protein